MTLVKHSTCTCPNDKFRSCVAGTVYDISYDLRDGGIRGGNEHPCHCEVCHQPDGVHLTPTEVRTLVVLADCVEDQSPAERAVVARLRKATMAAMADPINKDREDR